MMLLGNYPILRHQYPGIGPISHSIRISASLLAPGSPLVTGSGCIEVLKETRDGKTGTFSKTEAARQKVPHANTQARTPMELCGQTGNRQFSFSAFHPTYWCAIVHSQRIFLSFWPASWERGWKQGRFWSSLSVCVCVSCVCGCLLVINGGSSNIGSFSFWRITYSQSFLAQTSHKFWALSSWQSG